MTRLSNVGAAAPRQTRDGEARHEAGCTPNPHPLLDARPLLDAIDRHGDVRALLDTVGLSVLEPDGRRWKDSIRRIRRNGYVTPWLADRICVRLLGTVPALVFGQSWWDAIPDEEVAS